MNRPSAALVALCYVLVSLRLNACWPVDPIVSQAYEKELTKYGAPSRIVNPVAKDKFLIEYDRINHGPAWVLQKLGRHSYPKEMSDMSVPPMKFYPEPKLAEVAPLAGPFLKRLDEDDLVQLARPEDYFYDVNSRYQSYSSANVCKMDERLKNSVWAKLNELVRALAEHAKGEADGVFVVTGPIYKPVVTSPTPSVTPARTGRPGKKLVSPARGAKSSEASSSSNTITEPPEPTHFFKVLMLIQDNQIAIMDAFKIPNFAPKAILLSFYRVNVADLERETGLSFFPTAPGRNKNLADYRASLDTLEHDFGFTFFGKPELIDATHEDLTRFGLPDSNQVLKYDRYVLGYSKERKIPSWTLERFTREDIEGEYCKDKFELFFDPRLEERTVREDYVGYDPGHLVALANYNLSPKMRAEIWQSYSMANVLPLRKSFNRGIWLKMERWLRYRAANLKRDDSLYVLKAPLFSDEPITFTGPSKVAVPKGFLVVMLVVKQNKPGWFMAFEFPHKDVLDQDLNEYVIDADYVREIEHEDQLSVFPNAFLGELKMMEINDYDYEDFLVENGYLKTAS